MRSINSRIEQLERAEILTPCAQEHEAMLAEKKRRFEEEFDFEGFSREVTAALVWQARPNFNTPREHVARTVRSQHEYLATALSMNDAERADLDAGIERTTDWMMSLTDAEWMETVKPMGYPVEMLDRFHDNHSDHQERND